MQRKTVSIVAPCYNEEDNIQVLYERVAKAFSETKIEFEMIFVDDGSNDSSEKIYRDLAAADYRVRALLFSRNFRAPQAAFFAGMKYASGNAVVLMDGDLQDPPELIPKFIKKWEEGYDVVYGIRIKRKGSVMRRVGYKLFYRVFRKLAYINIPVDVGDFSLMDRRVVNEILKLGERDLRLRGLRAYVGFKQTGIPYVRDERYAGEAKTSVFSDLRFAKDLIINFSFKPIEWISRLAFLVVVFSIGLLVVNIVFYLIDPVAPQGIPTLIFLVLFLGGIQLLSLAVIGQYIAKALEEMKGRPRYIIKEIIGGVKDPSVSD